MYLDIISPSLLTILWYFTLLSWKDRLYLRQNVYQYFKLKNLFNFRILKYYGINLTERKLRPNVFNLSRQKLKTVHLIFSNIIGFIQVVDMSCLLQLLFDIDETYKPKFIIFNAMQCRLCFHPQLTGLIAFW